MGERGRFEGIHEPIRRLEQLEDELAAMGGMNEIRERVTNIRADIVDAEMERAVGEARFEYEMKNYGYDSDTWRPKDYETLEDAIEDMAADGWRYIHAFDNGAVFERAAGE
jgi:hypothetical protein